MHVGMCTIFQNPDKHLDDRSVYRNDLRLAELAEPLGFEYIGVFSYAGMPAGEAERNRRCFASEVMPRLQARAIAGKIAWAA